MCGIHSHALALTLICIDNSPVTWSRRLGGAWLPISDGFEPCYIWKLSRVKQMRWKAKDGWSQLLTLCKSLPGTALRSSTLALRKLTFHPYLPDSAAALGTAHPPYPKDLSPQAKPPFHSLTADLFGDRGCGGSTRFWPQCSPSCFFPWWIYQLGELQLSPCHPSPDLSPDSHTHCSACSIQPSALVLLWSHILRMSEIRWWL